MRAPKSNSDEKEKISGFEAWFDVWSDHCMVAAFFIFLVLLGFIV
ncbi:hypothetical protein [Salinimicrobium terrae]|nr:hypothetical protein [Salinimicrobium terrae]